MNPLSVKNLMVQLKEEKEATMKAKIQLMTMNGELVERDEQLAALKKSQADYEAQLREKDNLMKQDTMVRLQLGKRLEQVLMDKEDAFEQLEQLKVSDRIMLNRDKSYIITTYRPNWTSSREGCESGSNFECLLYALLLFDVRLKAPCRICRIYYEDCFGFS